MRTFVPGRELCRRFFHECAAPVLEQAFPGVPLSAGLLGYGSDVLGYDDEVSTDHMWGPRFYLFTETEDPALHRALLAALARGLPYTFEGYSVSFSAPDPQDNGVRHPEFIEAGEVSPLVFIMTLDGFLRSYLGTDAPERADAFEWLAFPEHRLLALREAQWYRDGLGTAGRLEPLRYYPEPVRRYLIAAQWANIAEEEAFVTRCLGRGDVLGSTLIAARIAERVMRLCFLYRQRYAPYSKWFGTAFSRLPGCGEIGEALSSALGACAPREREAHLCAALSRTVRLHNESGLTAPVDETPRRYFGRDILVVHASRLADAVGGTLRGTPLEHTPLTGSFSQLGGGMSAMTEEPSERGRLRAFFAPQTNSGETG